MPEPKMFTEQEVQKCCGNCRHFKIEPDTDEEYGDCQYPVYQFTPIFDALINCLPYAYKSNMENAFESRQGISVEFVEIADGTECPCFDAKPSLLHPQEGSKA